MKIENLPRAFDKRISEIDKDEDQLRVSLAGFDFNIADPIWVLDSETTINVSCVEKFSPSCREVIIETLAYFSEYRSAKYTAQHVYELRRYVKITSALTLGGLLAYKMAPPKKNREQYVSVLRCFFRQALYLGFDVPEDFMKEFNTWVLKGAEQGLPVLTQDPETGPFSELEFRAIKAGLDHKYAEEIISDRECSIAQLFAATFRRPSNLKQLKVKDLIASSRALATRQPIYQLNIPRAKGKGRRFRSQFKPFALIQSVGQVLSRHVEKTIENVSNGMGRELSVNEIKELPMFYSDQIFDDMKLLDDGQLIDYLKTELPHTKNSDLTVELRSVIERLEIVSERTGEPLRVTGYRFRYTGGTRAAEAGAGLVTIAELLDHTDTQHAGIYIANSPEIGEQISKIMNNPLARYASAFLGKVVADEDDACKENPNATRIPCREKDCDVGSCGTDSFCNDYAPVACYLCPKFRPWRDAPHYLILQWLIEERTRISNTIDDMKIVAINDSAILAVAQVMKLCEEEVANV